MALNALGGTQVRPAALAFFSFLTALLNSSQLIGLLSSHSCDNIHSWISLSGDLALSHQDGIYGFNFPKRFLEISSRDLTLLSILIIQDLITNPLVPFPFAFARLNALQAAVRHSHSLSDPVLCLVTQANNLIVF
jgi:hypothetical protein